MFRVALVMLSALFVFAAMELALRVMYARDQQRGGDLQRKLEQSSLKTLDETEGDYNMSGLVRASDHHDIVYALKPNLEGQFLKKTIKTNRHGFRDKDYEVAKPDKCYRIVGIGDSVMFGWGVDQHECYLDLLEEQLNKLSPPHGEFEVLNYAVPGYNTSMEVNTLELEALRFEPDMVIIQFVNNDYIAPMFMRKKIDYMTLKTSYAWQLMRQRVSAAVGKVDRNNRPENLVSERHARDWTEKEREELRDEYNHLSGYSAFKRSMKRLATLSQEHDFKVIVITGTLRGKQEEQLADACAKHGFHRVEIGPYTDRYLEAHGIPNEKKALRKALWVAPNDHHPNAAGHTIYATAVMDALVELGVVGEAGEI